MDIKKGNNKFYIGDTEESAIAKITWVPGGDNIIVVNHTLVDPSLRGQGIAGKLLAKVVEMAREENLKIHPTCSFAVVNLTRTNEYEDVLLGK